MHLLKAEVNFPPTDFVPCHLARINFIPIFLNGAKNTKTEGEKKRKKVFHLLVYEVKAS